jgi:hypothetical protein
MIPLMVLPIMEAIMGPHITIQVTPNMGAHITVATIAGCPPMLGINYTAMGMGHHTTKMASQDMATKGMDR